jgi:hypothetical protein
MGGHKKIILDAVALLRNYVMPAGTMADEGHWV